MAGAKNKRSMAHFVPTIDVEDFSSSGSYEAVPLKTEQSSTHLSPPRNKTEVSYSPSFESFAIFRDATFFDLSADRYCKKTSFLEGPKKFLRLCSFGFLIPVLLLSIPLYVRLILYPPTHTPMAPTDQRLMSGRVSSVWCKAQTVKMNGSFNAFLMDQKPNIRKDFSVHTMRRHIVLKDDVKEYWGFFLQKGSVVEINMCIRHDGGSLMILQGVNNLRKCAWIGEEDSAEQDEDHEEESNESGQLPEHSRYIPDGLQIETPQWNVSNENDVPIISPKKSTTSEERKKELDFFVRRVIQLSKNSKEILKSLNKNRKSKHIIEVEDSKVASKIRRKRKNKMTKHRKHSRKNAKSRLKRFLEENQDHDIDGEESREATSHKPSRKVIIKEYNATEDELYKRIFHVPEGLNIERGTFFDPNRINDSSFEEHRSSFSSSEEALLKCEGLLGAIPLYADRSCQGSHSLASSNVTYKIPKTGTYYFVFSSDNEIFDSDLYFNMTLKRVTYDTENPIDSCVNKSSCSLGFSFWSHGEAIVEVPEGDWDSAFIIKSKCEPRVSLYLLMVVLIPVFILVGAFH